MAMKTHERKFKTAFLSPFLLSAFVAFSAWSHESPPNCNANLMFINLALAPGQLQVVSFDSTVRLNVSVGNEAVDTSDPGKIGCDLSDVRVLLISPGQNGTPALGTTNVLARNLNLPAPLSGKSETNFVMQAILLYCKRATRAQVLVLAEGTLHDGQSPTGRRVRVEKTVSVYFSHPCITVTAQCINEATNRMGEVVHTVSGSVTNCGDETLVNIMMRDDHSAPKLIIDFGTNAIDPGRGVTFTHSYTNAGANNQPFGATFTATATTRDSKKPVACARQVTCDVASNARIKSR